MHVVAFLFAVIGDFAIFCRTFVIVIIPVNHPFLRPIVLMHVYGHIGVYVSGIVIRGFRIIPCHNLHNFCPGSSCRNQTGYVTNIRNLIRRIGQSETYGGNKADGIGGVRRCRSNLQRDRFAGYRMVSVKLTFKDSARFLMKNCLVARFLPLCAL